MDVLDALDEIQAINQRHERVDTNSVLDSLFDRSIAAKNAMLASGLTVADEELIKSIKFKQSVILNKDLPVVDENEENLMSSSKLSAFPSIVGLMQQQIANSSSMPKASQLKPIVMTLKKKLKAASDGVTPDDDVQTKKQRVVAVPATLLEQKKAEVVAPSGGLGGLMAYGTDDSD